MKKQLNKLTKTIILLFITANSYAQEASHTIDSDVNGYVDKERWELIWSDEFDYKDSKLRKNWISDDGRYKDQIACTRYRENAIVKDGILELIIKKENRHPKTEWTAGNIWTKKTYTYGYFEARYKYAAGATTNNAFWIMPAPETHIPEGGIKYEIDINEGHYPNELALDLHNWSEPIYVNGEKKFPRDQRHYSYGTEPNIEINLDKPITTQKIRFSSNHKTSFHIKEFKVYSLGNEVEVKNISSSAGDFRLENIIDNNMNTSWISPLDEDKDFTIEFSEARNIDKIEFTNGYISSKDNRWYAMITDYKIEAYINGVWEEVKSWDVRETTDFSEKFHTYGLEWTKEWLIYYFDGVEIRRERNDWCHNPGNVYLSLAILKYMGRIPDSLDGTSMKVDYVRIYKEKN